jgi:hypothetical protein
VAAGLTEVEPWAIDASILVGHVAAALALDKRLALPGPQDGDEEEGKVLIDPGEIGTAQAAVGAKARLLFESFPFRPDPADSDKDHDCPSHLPEAMTLHYCQRKINCPAGARREASLEKLMTSRA